MPDRLLRLGVFGAGYVGLATAAGFADLGHTVTVCDIDSDKIALLQAGTMPFEEPGLRELVQRNAGARRLEFTTDAWRAVTGCAIVFIAVGTPQAPDGQADICAVRDAATTIARAIDGPTLVVNRSTVPLETGELVASIVRTHTQRDDVLTASNPEFLREGYAVADFAHPDRIVLGCGDARAEAILRELYAPFDAPVFVADERTAGMIKYAANAFLATKISFVNQLANICERAGADIDAVVAGMSADRRIGPAFFEAGLGYGGSCLPKDIDALRATARSHGVEPILLDAVATVNRDQIARVVTKAAEHAGGLRGRRVAVWGLAFKAGTDDVRESPAIALIDALLAAGATVVAHDPLAASNARAVLHRDVELFDGLHHLRAVAGSDVLIVATGWPMYAAAELSQAALTMRGKIVIDARNILDPKAVRAAGFVYAGAGR